MCDSASKHELLQVKVGTSREERSDARAEPHSVISCDDFCKDPDHRKLAICSIICGLSCIGIVSLIYSVKARETRKIFLNEDTQKTQKIKEYSGKACKWGIASIAAWVVLIVIFPFLLGLLSFLMTFID